MLGGKILLTTGFKCWLFFSGPLLHIGASLRTVFCCWRFDCGFHRDIYINFVNKRQQLETWKRESKRLLKYAVQWKWRWKVVHEWNYTTLYIQFYSHEWKTGKVWQGGARQVAPSCPVWKVNTAGEGLALLHQVHFCQYYQLVYKSQATIPMFGGEQILRTTFNWYESSNNVTQIIFWSLCDMFLIICCRREDVYIPFHHSALKMLKYHILSIL